jgi:DNA polymerase IV (DinB-like DNA polymerase)
MAGGDRIILHLDMDSFYASVEVRERPDLRGSPVVVGADPRGGAGRGVVSTCSYEARRYGIHSGQPISRAYDLCPYAVFLPVNRSLYSRVSENVMQIIRWHGAKLEQVSIDEAYLDVTGTGSFAEAERLARRIKNAIREEERLTCSVGIAPSKVVAKIASDWRKPDGLTVVTPDRVVEFLAPLPVGKMPGVGKKTGTELAAMGVGTVGDLAAYDIQELMARFGRWGMYLHRLARGVDDREVEAREGAKSISRETTFDADTDDPLFITDAMDLLADDLARTLAADDLRFRNLTVKVRYRGFITRTRSRTLEHHTCDPALIRAGARQLLADFLDGRYVRLIGLRLSMLDDDRARQTSLDEFCPVDPRKA